MFPKHWYNVKPKPKLNFQIERDNLKKLVEEGRFEILTGGWVMTDEANVHIFAMVDQLIEGTQLVGY